MSLETTEIIQGVCSVSGIEYKLELKLPVPVASAAAASAAAATLSPVPAPIPDKIRKLADMLPGDLTPIQYLDKTTSLPLGVIRALLSKEGLPRAKHYEKICDLALEERVIVASCQNLSNRCGCDTIHSPVPYYDSLYRECVLAREEFVNAFRIDKHSDITKTTKKILRVAVEDWVNNIHGAYDDSSVDEEMFLATPKEE